VENLNNYLGYFGSHNAIFLSKKVNFLLFLRREKTRQSNQKAGALPGGFI